MVPMVAWEINVVFREVYSPRRIEERAGDPIPSEDRNAPLGFLYKDLLADTLYKDLLADTRVNLKKTRGYSRW